MSDPESGDKYTLNNSKKVLTVNVKDGTVPTITIANADKIVAPGTATFTLTADPQPKGPLTIRVTPTETGSSFLSPAFGTSTTPKDLTSLNFASASAPYIETFTVQTVVDNSNSNGIISIEILADENTTDPAYKISTTPAENTGTVSVFSYSNIELSIEETTLTATEGDTNIEITVTASANPSVSIPVSFTPTDTTGTFLKNDDDGNGSGDSRIEMLTFTDTSQSGQPAKWQGTFTINTKDNNNTDEADGEIEVKLETHDRGNYTVSATTDEDHVDITVYDATKPTITIGTADPVFHHENIVNNVYEFRHELTLVSDVQPHAALNVKYSLTETGTDFLRPSNPNNRNLTFTAANPATDPQTYLGTLPIELREDEGEASGTYTLTIQEDANNYSLGTGIEKSKPITVNDPSYVELNTYRLDDNYTGATLIRDPDNNGNMEVAFYITDPSKTHEVKNTTRVLGHEIINKLTIGGKWYFNDSTIAAGTSNTLTNVSEGTITTDIGRWVLPGGGWSNPNPHRAKFGSKFINFKS